ncbi:MAG: DNA repair helicase XPB [Acidimicrobiales bacterium]
MTHPADPANPLIVQSDLTVLLEVASPRAGAARERLARFADLERAPEHVHTYRITPLSLWNAAVAGLSADEVVDALTGFAKYPVPDVVIHDVIDQIGRYGRVWLARVPEDGLVLVSDDDVLLDELAGVRGLGELLGRRLDRHRFAVREHDRGALKQALLAAGWPAADEAGFETGVALDPVALGAELRPYQADALHAWWRDGEASGGSGVVVLPCGAGKTVVGLAAIAASGAQALVVCTSVSSIRQWMREALDKTSLAPDDLGEWSGERKQLRPVTFVTYQSLTWADPAAAADADVFERHPHLSLFSELGWGLVVYDEVHLLPAPVFRAAARIQAVRRLGLTATLVREDRREPDIFSLIGPKRYDAPWAEVEAAGWIAPAACTEIRVPLGAQRRAEYAAAEPKLRHRVAATAPEKLAVVETLVERHRGEQVLVIGQFVEQLREAAERLGAPLLTGQSAQSTRERIFGDLRAGRLRVLVVSKIANFSIDLPEVSVAIQLSGQYGSRQEEAQRLGRILRPKANGASASFYTVIAEGTDEVRFARNRQRFLAEQGYSYTILDAEAVVG